MHQLIAMEWSSGYQFHPAYNSLLKVTWKPENTGYENLAKLNQILQDFHGRVFEYNLDKVLFEFDSQEDLTIFVLTWS